MNLDRFLRDRRPAWSELESLIAAAGRRPERLGPERARRLGALYRRAAADLALARRSFPADPVVPQLEDRVRQARHLVYDAGVRRQSLVQFLTTGYWRRVRERPALLLAAAGLLLVPAALSVTWGLVDPASAGGLAPAELRGGTEPGSGGLDFSPGRSALFSSAVLTNNIEVSFMAFVGGVTAGLLTAAVLLYNGMSFGVVTGLLFQAGHGAPFVELVAPHGVLELSCIVVAGAAGLRMGWAIVDPGRLRRSQSLARGAREGVELALGTAPWLVVAGLVEGFVTPERLGPAPAVAVGLLLGAAYWVLVLWRGRPPATAGPAPSS